MSSILPPEWVEMELGDMSKSIFNELPLSEDKADLKKSCLETACALQDGQLLKLLAETRDGLIDSKLRSKIWPQLLGFPIDPQLGYDFTSSPPHKDEDQVSKDIDRSFVYYPQNEARKQELKSRLSDLIVGVLRANPELHYYQGYHDIASIVVMVFENDNEAFQFLSLLTQFHLRDHMMSSIDSSVQQLEIIGDLMGCIDPKFNRVISSVNPIYSLSSILSLFAHNIQSFEDLCLIWDFVFAEKTMVLPLYIYVSVLVYFKEEILTKLEEESGSSFSSEDTYFEEDDLPMNLENNLDILHSILTNVVGENLGNEFEIFQVLHSSVEYLQNHPPSQLKCFQTRISEFSVLKTTSKPEGDVPVSSYLEDDRLSTLITKQIDEDKAKAEKRRLQLIASRRPRKTSSMDNLRKYLYDRVLINRNRKLKVSMFVKISFTIGILSFLLHYYTDKAQFRSLYGAGVNGVHNMVIVKFASFSNTVAGINFGAAKESVFGLF
ncbi:unnamed protein product [Kuraishia capsulata CBS 1993]|uniref:Rab-GAP TBC domain-containing protein n=1 Tax=Kuraishia capsulata CBS 1993 TaxID=1382522 RepID=W6MJR3_9ASCO|nr:uncharacterized protein KUCA_T00002199001 [Kuraishia capsulata CBS 1993]CDK26228.1 unnamed protein product [Kuraishia capsulata CBS 1993]